MPERNPILITGAAGEIGGVSRTMVDILLEQGHPVRAFVRQDDERAHSLRQAGAEVCPHPAGEAERLRQAG